MNDFADLYREMDRIKEIVGKDFTPVAEEADAYLNQRITENFAARQTPDGVPWPGDATEVLTGEMLAELKEREITNGRRLSKGSGKDYAPYQQFGVLKRGKKRKKKLGPPKPGSRAFKALVSRKRGRRRRRKKARPLSDYRQPPRPVIGVTETDADKIGEMTAEFVTARLMR